MLAVNRGLPTGTILLGALFLSLSCGGADSPTHTGPVDSPGPARPVDLVFVQSEGTGYASYHVDEVDDIYVSY